MEVHAPLAAPQMEAGDIEKQLNGTGNGHAYPSVAEVVTTTTTTTTTPPPAAPASPPRPPPAHSSGPAASVPVPAIDHPLRFSSPAPAPSAPRTQPVHHRDVRPIFPAKRVASEPLPLPSTTLAKYMAQHPNATVAQAMRKLYPKANPVVRLAHRFKVKHSVIDGMTAAERKYWEERGPDLRRKAGWKLAGEDGPGVEVSELFWEMYLSLMPTITRDPLAGMTTPDLLGSTTTMPLSIISLIPDIIRHFRDVIVRAQTEVFVATNYWQPSDSVSMIAQALRDLSARVVKDGRPKVVVKIMYDRGSWAQLWNAHAPVATPECTKLDIPTQDEVPGLHLEVVNFHKVLLGTFHAKFIIVDRKVVLLSSNNVQDRPNLELMTHLEGPVVDSFYDVALHSWYNKLSPPLPELDKPYEPPRDESGNPCYLFRDHNPYFRDIEVLKAARAARKLLRRQTEDIDADRARALDQASHPAHERLREAVRQAMASQRQNLQNAQDEIALRSAHTIKELRGFGERMGFGSRPGSRRTSHTDLTKLTRDDYDDETAANSAANAMRQRAPGSEARTSPTLTEQPLPARSKTMPVEPVYQQQQQPHHPRFSIDNASYDPTTTANTSQRQSFHSARETFSDHHQVTLPPIASLDIPPLTGAMFDGPIEENAAAAATTAPTEKAQSVVESEHDPESPFTHESEKKPRPKIIIPASAVPGHVTPGNATPPRAASPHAHGASTPRSFRWHEDLASGAQSPLYYPRASVDEPIPPEGGTKRMFKLSKRFNAGALSEAWATVEDSDDLDEFRPHVVHAPHDPFPVAMCCRRPHGMPGHQDIRNPQNAAWLAGCRYAKKKVFIQTPTLNARPIVRAIMHACRRGVQVELLLDLGFNDMGESIPGQGGTNEQVVDRLYKKLGAEGKSKHLQVYWYTGKDQIRPLNAVKKQRNCHIKLALYDDEVLILGNGNQDSQSWFHSQEINVMLDSKQVAAEIMETLLVNQNTIRYGGVEADGVWRDDEGKTLADYGATGGGGLMGGVRAMINFAKQAAK